MKHEACSSIPAVAPAKVPEALLGLTFAPKRLRILSTCVGIDSKGAGALVLFSGVEGGVTSCCAVGGRMEWLALGAWGQA